jgi:hypothetical protein
MSLSFGKMRIVGKNEFYVAERETATTIYWNNASPMNWSKKKVF